MDDLQRLLDELRGLPAETTWVEFKENNSAPQAIGDNLSALANSACLERKEKRYLVFGIEDGTHDVKGTPFDPSKAKGKGNQDLELWLANVLEPRVAVDITPVTYRGKPIVVFAVSPAPSRPVAFYGKESVRIGSNTTLLKNHPERQRAIWHSGAKEDWSAQTCPRARLADLCPDTIRRARVEYAKKNPKHATEVENWSDITFLNKARVTIGGQITNAALLLLGKAEASDFLSPAVAQISWFLRDQDGNNQDYEHFAPPFLLNVDKILAKVRNLRYRYLPDNTLFPTEIDQYDGYVIREALHNCIAHQDYGLRGRINVVENPDGLVFTNLGAFLPGTIDAVIQSDSPPECYRNHWLATAMVNLNMIDTQGGGIRKMFLKQRERFFPLPGYDLADPARVVAQIPGRILDENYTRILMEQSDLDLGTVILLDQVQKGAVISKRDHSRLKKRELVEGRYPHLVISKRLAGLTGKEAEHVRRTGLDRQLCQEYLLKLIGEHGPVGRDKIDDLLMDYLPGDEKRKKSIVHNMLCKLRATGKIQNVGSKRKSAWIVPSPASMPPGPLAGAEPNSTHSEKTEKNCEKHK